MDNKAVEKPVNRLVGENSVDTLVRIERILLDMDNIEPEDLSMMDGVYHLLIESVADAAHFVEQSIRKNPEN